MLLKFGLLGVAIVSKECQSKRITSKIILTLTYLFISMDKNYESWKKGIEKYEFKGEHYLTHDGMKGVFGKSINLDWIPRYMIS